MPRIFAPNAHAEKAIESLKYSLFPHLAPPQAPTGCTGTRAAGDPPDVVVEAEENDGSALEFVALNSGDLRVLAGDRVLCARTDDETDRPREWSGVQVPHGQPVTIHGEGSFEVRFASQEAS